MTAYLHVHNGPAAGQRLNLSGEAVLGRHPDCDIVLDVGAVSRYHAKFVPIGKDFHVKDMDSRNGTYVNDVRISEERPLREGDRIHVCGVTMTFHYANAASPAESHARRPPVISLDEFDTENSTIMSKLDISSTDGGIRVSASPEVRLNAMLQIMRSLSGTLSLDQVLPQVLDALFRIFLHADRGFIVLLEPDGKLVPRWSKFRRPDADDSVRISRTVIRRVLESQEAVLSKDAAGDDRFDMSQSISDFQIRSMMCAPLIDANGTSLGVLQVDTFNQRHHFCPDDLEVLAGIAAQAAIAISNAQLHEKLVHQREIEHELQLAHEVQRSFLPRRRPQVTGYAYFDYYRPANHVGGDYYDYVALPGGSQAIVVADVVGHGMPAALLMARLSAEVRSCLLAEGHPSLALNRLNRSLCDDEMEDRFVTLIVGVVHPEQHAIVLANAGHMAPLIRRHNGELLEVGRDQSGIPLSIQPEFEYPEFSLEMDIGDMLVFYTDGITEAENPQEEQYSLQRMAGQLLRPGSLDELGKRILDDVHGFQRGGPQKDDMCLVCLQRNS